MSSPEESTSESETTVRPKPFSMAPNSAAAATEESSKSDVDEDSKTSSSSSSSVDSSDEEEENKGNQYYRKMQVFTEELPITDVLERRLDTVEELTEPLSSGYFLESLGGDYPKFTSSYQEEYGTSEVEVSNSTVVHDLISMEDLERQFQNVALTEPRRVVTSVVDAENATTSKGETTERLCTTFSCEEKSVSIQSPSERVPNILRNQIFKLLTSSDDEEAQEGVERSPSSSKRGELYRASDEGSECSLEKHEFENDEKNSSSEKIDVLLEERSDVVSTRVELSLFEEIGGALSPLLDNDSGIEGFSKSDMNKPNCIWSKLNSRRVAPKAPHTSKVIGEICTSGTCSSSISLLNLQIQELISKLSQVEGEKQKIAEEAYHRTLLIRREASHKIEGVHKAQAKQANLVHRLQRKLSEMKKSKEGLESKLLDLSEVSLSTQSEFDDSKEMIKTYEESLQALEKKHAAESEALRSRNKSLTDNLQSADKLNSVLSQQIQDLRTQNESLLANANTCESHWEELRSQITVQEKNLEERIKFAVDNNEDGRCAGLSHKVYGLKRDLMDLKEDSGKEIMKMKNQMLNESQDIVTTCLRVGRRGLGLNEDLIERNSGLVRDNCGLQSQVSQLESHVKRLEGVIAEKEKIIRSSQGSPEPLESVVNASATSISQLEEYNHQLEASLTEIGHLVLEDAKSVKCHHQSLLNLSGGEMAHRGRPRSASLEVGEFTPAVQAALNRRQVQVHDLRMKLVSCQDRLCLATKKIKDKSDCLEGTERKLELERSEFDSLRIKIDELNEDKFRALERVEGLLMERNSSEKRNEMLGEELHSLTIELAALKEAHEEDLRRLDSHKGKLSGLLLSNKGLSEEVGELRAEVAALEDANAELKKDLCEKRESLEVVSQSVELLQHEKELHVRQALSVSKEHKDSEAQILGFKKQENLLKHSLASLEEEKRSLQKDLTELGESLLEAKGENEALHSEVRDKSQQIKRLQESASESDAKMRDCELLGNASCESLKVEKATRERLERELSSLRREKEDLEESHAGLTLVNEALKDEAALALTKFNKMEEQYHRASKETLELTRAKSELDVRVEESSRSLSSLEETLRDALSDKSEILKLNATLKSQMAELSASIQGLQGDRDELSKKCELQGESLRSLQAEMDEETLSKQMIRNSYENKLRDLEKVHESQIRKVLSENKSTSSHREEIRAKFEQEYDELISQRDKEIGILNKKVLKADEEIKFLKSRVQEDLILAENAKQNALTMAEREKLEYVNKCSLLQNELDILTEEFLEYKKDSGLKIEDGREKLYEAESNVSRLKSKLQDQHDLLEEERSRQLQVLEVERRKSSQLNTEVQDKTIHYERSKDSLDDLQNSLSRLESSLATANEKNERLTTELNKRDVSLSVLKHENESLSKARKAINEKLKHLEIEKMEHRSRSQDYDEKMTQLRVQAEDLKSELNDVRSKYEEQLDSYQRKDLYSSEIDRNFNEINQRYKELEANYKSIAELTEVDNAKRKAVETEVESLRRKVSELSEANTQQSNIIAELNHKHESKEASFKKKADRLLCDLEALRSRKRELETRNYELSLLSDSSKDRNAQQELEIQGQEARISALKDLTQKLGREKKLLKSELSSLFALLGPVNVAAYDPEDDEGSNTLGLKLFKSKLSALMVEMSALEKEREELRRDLRSWQGTADSAERQVKSLERKNTGLLAEVRECEEQLKKMEDILSKNDVLWANQQEELQKKDAEIAALRSGPLQQTHKVSSLKTRKYKSLESEQYEVKRSTLLQANKEFESQLIQIKLLNESLEGDKQRLEMMIATKDSEIEILRRTNEKLKATQRHLSEEQASLVKRLRSFEDERNSKQEPEFETFLRIGLRSLNSNEAYKLIQDLETDKKDLKNELSKMEGLLHEYKTTHHQIQRKYDDTNRGGGVHELKEHDLLKRKLSNIHEQINIFSSTNAELRRMSKSGDRPQMNLNIDKNSSFDADCKEHIVQIRILENRVHLYEKRNKALEEEIHKLTTQHGARIKDLIRERQQERHKENKRSREDYANMLHNYLSKETLYKEKIRSLEDEIGSLRRKVSTETVLRQSLISNDYRLSNDISDLHFTLGQSLDKVSSSVGKELLASETSKLNQTADVYYSSGGGRDKSGQFLLSPAIQRSRSANNLSCLCSTPKTTIMTTTGNRKIRSSKKSLHFN